MSASPAVLARVAERAARAARLKAEVQARNAEGWPDWKIARATGVTADYIRVVRRRLGLAVNPTRRVDPQRTRFGGTP